jgi:hypothetical protein
MNVDDLILVSIDDHVVEPPDMFLRHVPTKYKDEAPIVVTDDTGGDQWKYPWRGPKNGAVTRPVSPRCAPVVYDVHDPGGR